MIFDLMTELSDNQDIHAGSCSSPYSYDTGVRSNYDDAWTGSPLGVGHPGQQNVGAGNVVKVLFNIFGATASSGAPTLQISLQDSADNSSFSTIASSEVFSVATLQSMNGNFEWEIDVPSPTRRYIQGYYTIGGSGGFSALSISAHVVLDVQDARSF
jgi:hypothetical protein